MSSEIPTASEAEGPDAPKSWFARTFPTFSRIKQWPAAFVQFEKRVLKKLPRVLAWPWRALRFIFKWRPKLLLRLMAVLVVAHTAFNIYASVLLNRELAEIRAKGEPLKMSEIAPPPVPDSQNAALVYQQATNALQDMKGGSFPALSDFDNPTTARALIAALRKNQKAIALIRRATAMPRCRFPNNWNQSPAQILFPYYAHQRQLARLLAAQAQWEAQQGDVDAALRDVRGIHAIATHLQGEPVLIGFLVSAGINAMASKTLAHVMAEVPIPAAKAQTFLKTLPVNDWDGAFRHTYLGERIFGTWAFSNIQFSPVSMGGMFPLESESPIARWVATPAAWVWKPFAKMDEVYILRIWKRLIASVTPMEMPMPTGEGQNFDQEIQNAPRYAILTRVLFPVYSSFRRNRDRVEVVTRLQRVALALSSYKAAKGTYPDSLKEAEALWGAKLPLDLYGDKPFVYKKQGSSFLLYSIGDNRTDDGGLTPRDARPTALGSYISRDDIVWGDKIER